MTKYVRTKLYAFWMGLRREHAIVSLMWPVDDGTLISIKVIILAMIAAGVCAGSGMLCRAVFRWGNKGKRFQRRVKEKKAAMKELKPGDDRGAELSDAERMKQAFQK